MTDYSDEVYLRDFEDVERTREVNEGVHPVPADEPYVVTYQDGEHGRYEVVAVYEDGREQVLSRWSTSTRAAENAGRIAEHGGAFSFIGVRDQAEPERWLECNR